MGFGRAPHRRQSSVKEEDNFTTWHLEYKINNVPLYPNDFVILPLPMVARRSRWRLHANAAVAVAKADGNGSKQDVAIRGLLRWSPRRVSSMKGA
jgi:hypothetical protein